MSHFDGDDDGDAEWEDSNEPDESDAGDQHSVDTDPCPHCGKAVHEDAQQCPHCHQYIDLDTSRSRKPLWIVLGALVALAAILVWSKW